MDSVVVQSDAAGGATATDFIAVAQRAAEDERQANQTRLCCCEYIDRDKKHFHILGCCCNCEDLDSVFTRLINCRSIDPQSNRRMLLTFQDRLRIPWRGGAKQVSLDALLPVVAIPIMIAIAAINAYTAAVMFLSGTVFLGYAYHYVRRTQSRTRFFSMWVFWSVVYMAALFEFTAPLQEFLPEENLILVLFATASLFCLWRAKKRAALNHVVQSSVAEDELPDITEASAAEEEEAAAQTALLMEEHDALDELVDGGRHQPNICAICRKYVTSRTAHCSICSACIKRRDHHSYWLNCCIGEWNHHSYLAGLVLAELTLLLGADLIMTAVCHPYLVVRLLTIPFLLPDDCSEVFEEYILGVSFVIAIYALLMAAYLLVAILWQFYLISRGANMQGSQHGTRGNRKTCWINWKSFLFS